MNLNYLKVKHKNSLLQLLHKYEEMFDGTLSNYTGFENTIELKEMQSLFFIPKFHKLTLKKVVDKLFEKEVLKKINNSQSAAPTFIIPEINDTVRFISDFRELNKSLKTKSYLIPKHSRFIF